jgi:hypothetical protein
MVVNVISRKCALVLVYDAKNTLWPPPVAALVRLHPCSLFYVLERRVNNHRRGMVYLVASPNNLRFSDIAFFYFSKMFIPSTLTLRKLVTFTTTDNQAAEKR